MHEIKFLPSFGRKRARGLSETQKNNLVNLYEIFGIEIPAEKISPQELFKENYEKIFFEIGFGHGEHLIQNAILNPDIGFIGCEPFENGVASILKEIQEKNLKNVVKRENKSDENKVVSVAWFFCYITSCCKLRRRLLSSLRSYPERKTANRCSLSRRLRM